MRFTLRDAGLFAFAGIWEQWPGGPGGAVRTCAILTPRPSDLVTTAHNRMPVILSPNTLPAQWCAPTEQQGAPRLKP